MTCIRRHFTPLLTGVMALCLSGCTASLANFQRNSASLPTAGTIQIPITIEADSVTSTPAQPQSKPPIAKPSLNAIKRRTAKAQSTKTIAVSVYRVDSQCQALVPEKVAVSAKTPVSAAVGKVLEKADSADFELSGYRVNVNASSGIATVDLRRSPNSPRQFVSLSSCEQFALFGSLRKTLTENPRWKIKTVRFTEQGRQIEL